MGKWKVLTMVGLSGLVLAACGDDAGTTETPTTDDTTGQTETSSVTDDTGTVDDTGSEMAGTLSMQDAVDIYMREYPDAGIQQVDFDKDWGKWTYEITGVFEDREYKIEIDAESGDVVEVEEDDVDDHPFLVFDNLITPDEAVAIAQDALNEEATLEGWELEAEDDHADRVKYEIDFEGDDKDIKVDAETGEVLERD